MKHQMRKFKLGRTKEHRQALWSNLFRSLTLHGKIQTTRAKAKSLLPIAEKYINMAKEKNLTNFRKVLSFLRNDEIAANKIFDRVQNIPNSNGGYLKIVNIGQRLGDSSHVSCIMFAKEEK